MKNHLYKFLKSLEHNNAIALALLDDNGQLKTELSYHDLLIEIIAYSSYYQSNFAPADRIVLFELNGMDFVVHWLALVSAGLVATPIDNRLDSAAIYSVLKTIEPQLIVTHNKHNQHNFGTIETVLSTEIEVVRKLSEQTQETFWRNLANFDESKPAAIALTSGSWSNPKAATLSVENIFSNATAVLSMHPSSAGDRFLSILPLSHMFELTVGMLAPLHSGAAIFYLPTISAKGLTNAIRVNQLNYLVAVPRVLSLLRKGIAKKIPNKTLFKVFERVVSWARFLPLNWRRKLFQKIRAEFGGALEIFVIGGAELKQPLSHLFQGLGYLVFHGYGLTETSPVISSSISQKRKPHEVGYVLPNLKINIDSDTEEIFVQGPNVFLGYWPELDVDQSEFYATGDTGKLTKDGKLFVTGRVKNLIVYPSGDKIYLEEIESILEQFSEIDDVASVGISESREIIVILQQTQANIDLGLPTDLEIAKSLPGFVKLSKVVRTTKQLPRTHTLKLNRGKLLEFLDQS